MMQLALAVPGLPFQPARGRRRAARGRRSTRSRRAARAASRCSSAPTATSGTCSCWADRQGARARRGGPAPALRALARRRTRAERAHALYREALPRASPRARWGALPDAPRLPARRPSASPRLQAAHAPDLVLPVLVVAAAGAPPARRLPRARGAARVRHVPPTRCCAASTSAARARPRASSQRAWLALRARGPPRARRRPGRPRRARRSASAPTTAAPSPPSPTSARSSEAGTFIEKLTCRSPGRSARETSQLLDERPRSLGQAAPPSRTSSRWETSSRSRTIQLAPPSRTVTEVLRQPRPSSERPGASATRRDTSE